MSRQCGWLSGMSMVGAIGMQSVPASETSTDSSSASGRCVAVRVSVCLTELAEQEVNVHPLALMSMQSYEDTPCTQAVIREIVPSDNQTSGRDPHCTESQDKCVRR